MGAGCQSGASVYAFSMFVAMTHLPLHAGLPIGFRGSLQTSGTRWVPVSPCSNLNYTRIESCKRFPVCQGGPCSALCTIQTCQHELPETCVLTASPGKEGSCGFEQGCTKQFHTRASTINGMDSQAIL